MNRTLGEHIAELESRIRRLNEEAMEQHLSRVDLNRIEADIRATNLALTHFRTAIDLERQLKP